MIGALPDGVDPADVIDLTEEVADLAESIAEVAGASELPPEAVFCACFGVIFDYVRDAHDLATLRHLLTQYEAQQDEQLRALIHQPHQGVLQ